MNNDSINLSDNIDRNKINLIKKRHIEKNKKRKLFQSFVIIIGILIIFNIIGFCSYFIIDMNYTDSILKNYKTEYETIRSNLDSELNDLYYSKKTLLKEINDLTYSKNELEKYYIELSKTRIIEKYVPENTGSIHSFMAYNQDWVSYSFQYKLHNDISNDVWYDEYGYARYKDKYFVAVKPYYGDIGDFIDVYKENGIIIPCIIGDNKGFENDDIYIHHDGSIVEFMVDNITTFKGVINTHPEFCQPIISIKNIGSYYE